MSVMKSGFQQSPLELIGDVQEKPTEEMTEAGRSKESPPLKNDTDMVW